MIKYNRILALLMGVVFIVNVLLVAGCSANASDGKNAEEQVEAVMRECYDAQIAGDYEAAAKLLIFSERTSDLKVVFPDAFATEPVQSYTIYETKKLTDELYAVNVIGVFLASHEYVHGKDGKTTGWKESTREGWYLNHFDRTHYAAFVDGKWGVCNTARFVPEGMYDFPEKELKGGEEIQPSYEVPAA